MLTREFVYRINVIFVDKDGEEIHIKVPVGMNILEAAHENDIELEGTILSSFHLSFCFVLFCLIIYFFRLNEDSNYLVFLNFQGLVNVL